MESVKCMVDEKTLKDSRGVYKTQSLFREYRFSTTSSDAPIYNLKERDEHNTISMKRIYVACASEYEAAMTLLGSWLHWKKLCKTAWFKSYRNAWEEERTLREQALAKRALITKAEEGNVNAAKLLYQNKAKSKTNPNNEEDHTDSRIDQFLNDGLKLVKDES